MDVKSRHHLRSDAVDEISESLAGRLGIDVDADTFERVELEGVDWEVVLVDGEPLAFYVDRGAGRSAGSSGDNEPFLTVRGANAYQPRRRTVTVDAGAVQFVSDGADVMRPGIVAADEVIESGDLVAVDEESHGKFLAVGRALTDGTDMTGTDGRVVDSLHHVGDDLYEFSV
jgi:PUA-domain protein